MKALLLATGLHLLPMPATDKIAHTSVSANLTVFGLNLLKDGDISWQDRVISSFVAFQIGMAKEMHDPVFDLNDLKADALGILLGNIITIRF